MVSATLDAFNAWAPKRWFAAQSIAPEAAHARQTVSTNGQRHNGCPRTSVNQDFMPFILEKQNCVLYLSPLVGSKSTLTDGLAERPLKIPDSDELTQIKSSGLIWVSLAVLGLAWRNLAACAGAPRPRQRWLAPHDARSIDMGRGALTHIQKSGFDLSLKGAIGQR
jgi:hypothetical protein